MDSKECVGTKGDQPKFYLSIKIDATVYNFFEYKPYPVQGRKLNINFFDSRKYLV